MSSERFFLHKAPHGVCPRFSCGNTRHLYGKLPAVSRSLSGFLRECKHTNLFCSLRRKTEESLKASCFQDWLCVCVKRKKKNPFYFNSENQRGYLTDFPFVLLIVLMKPKKPKICFLFGTVCAQLLAFVLSLLNDYATLSHLLSLSLSLFSPASVSASNSLV